ncbi:MAG: DUF1800 domain-containing protein [Acidobacteria bacterium]|nr:DUF1800 domain-containing protein [Acidobacteriota bacterium]
MTRTTEDDSSTRADNTAETAGVVSRRAFFTAGLGGATWLGAGSAATAQDVAPGGNPFALRPFDKVYLLVNRITQGFTQRDYRRAKQMGYEAYLEEQLDYLNINDTAMDNRLAPYTTLGMSNAELIANYPPDGPNPYQPAGELIEANLLRSIFSKRQLHQRMVEFWTDHLNTFILDGPLIYFKTVEDREVIRQHALGNFGDLLRASARGAAMLYYLDNYANITGAPQENYGRELMELHSMGILNGQQPFTETDVVEVARCLTGWTIDGSAQNFGDFVYYPPFHDNGPKTVLGVSIPAGGGESDGDTVLDILINRPETATYIAYKMARWLLAYEPPARIVERTAAEYTRTGGDIKAMIRIILAQKSMTITGQKSLPKLRRPYHFIIALLRATRAQVISSTFLFSYLDQMGNVPYLWPAPDGYPDALDDWGSGLLPRWGFAAALLGNQVPGVTVNLNQFFAQVGGIKPQLLVHQINKILADGNLAPQDMAHVQGFLDSQPFLTGTVILEAIALAASSPSYQFY